jgi:hypothetical protein
VTLANMLRVVQKDAADASVAAAFNEQLQASGAMAAAVDLSTCCPCISCKQHAVQLLLPAGSAADLVCYVLPYYVVSCRPAA